MNSPRRLANTGVNRQPGPGGAQPRWSRDGKKVFFVEGNTLVAVRIGLSPNFVVGEAEQLFASSYLSLGYDVSVDGRFVMVEDVLSDAEQQRKPAIH